MRGGASLASRRRRSDDDGSVRGSCVAREPYGRCRVSTAEGLPRVFLTRELPPQPMRLLEERTRLTYNGVDRPLTREELLEGVADAEGLLSLLTDRIDGELMDAAPDLKVIANYAVGYNNIDVAAATSRDRKSVV